jgi:hypothetical protein
LHSHAQVIPAPLLHAPLERAVERDCFVCSMAGTALIIMLTAAIVVVGIGWHGRGRWY